MKKHPLNPDARKLEEKFFAEENRLLLQRLREKQDLEARRAAMREVMPTADDAFVDHMLELGIGPETALAVTFLPLVMVAWADGEISPKERDALLKAAEERGVTPGTASCEMLRSWLEHKPGSELTEAWKRYVGRVWYRPLGADGPAHRESATGTCCKTSLSFLRYG